MSRKLALRKLKASDLSFFQAYLNQYLQSKQKGFNLDRSVVESALFPSLTAAIEATSDKRAPVVLTFFGPGGAPPYLLMRKVLKAQKNWRLNGEAVHNPDGEPDRFNAVAPGDIAVRVVLLSATVPDDAAFMPPLPRRFQASRCPC